MKVTNKKILFILGTRPEAIKLAPLIIKFRLDKKYETKVCITAQHREMLDHVLSFFEIIPDYDLNLMKHNQTLPELTANAFKEINLILLDFKPECVFVQGDTTTAFVGALAAYYNKIKVAHVEAGLRSGNKYAPFPEEINRKLISQIADYHFAPTELSLNNLHEENITTNVFNVGNTVIDALLLALNKIKSSNKNDYSNKFSFLDFSKKIILLTVHRRENFGAPFIQIIEAIKELAAKYKDDVQFIYPVHLNPNIKIPVDEHLSNIKNVFLIEPLQYSDLVWLMFKSYMVLTDSGGIQEEAPSFGKPVLVLRDVTERPEGITAGVSKLVGTYKNNIINEVELLIKDSSYYEKMSKTINPYGDGTTSDNIIKTFKNLNL